MHTLVYRALFFVYESIEKDGMGRKLIKGTQKLKKTTFFAPRLKKKNATNLTVKEITRKTRLESDALRQFP